MEILLTDIIGKNGSFQCSENLDFSEDGFKLNSPVEAGFKLRQQSEKVYTLSGDLQALAEFGCDRCGKTIHIELEQHFEYILRIEDEPQLTDDYQCSDEDCETLYLAQASFESRDLLVEQLLLVMPTQRLCDEACKGLCQECGINLNKKKCQCGDINKNSPFAILQKLQKK